MLLSFLCIAFKLYPEQIIFIRHSEKDSDPVHLSSKGYLRAGSLPAYIERMIHRGIMYEPDHLVAMKQKSPKHSNRPFETVVPLSQKFDLAIQNEFEATEIDRVVASINNPIHVGKTVLVCWAHEELSQIAKALNMPVNKWRKNDYKTVWILTNNGKSARFQSYEMLDIDNVFHDIEHIKDGGIYDALQNREFEINV